MEPGYRRWTHPKGLERFGIVVKQTDLWVAAERRLEKDVRDLVLSARHGLEQYIKNHPEFVTSLSPLPPDPLAPPMVKEMLEAARLSGVGPMAAVAGAIAQFVGQGLLRKTSQVIVENGGDIFLATKEEVTVKLWAGTSPFGQRLGLSIPSELMPLGVCSSSATVGHSLSFGRTDLVTVMAESAPLADAAATALGNKVKGKEDIKAAIEWGRKRPWIKGIVLILNETLATWGEVELVEL